MMDKDSNVDANSLLTELDKGLRSSKIGDQCESIVRFPWLFERYPFPILINSACLKLAEVFRNNTNFSRVLILKVMQQCERHLEKIVNVDEFVRRLFAVTYSNDPLARAITLKAFASIAHVVANKRNLHHYIRNSLDASDELELEAAIEATVCFASKCNDFASNVYPKVVVMINRNNTSVDTKISLLSVLHHVNYNIELASAVREHCVHFLPIYSSREKFVCACLHTLTLISSASLTHIPQQIDLLLSYLKNDTRDSVKVSALRDLKLLASSSPHLWQNESIMTLVESLVHEEHKHDMHNKILKHVLLVITALVNSPCILSGQIDLLRDIYSKTTRLCLHIIYYEHNNIEIVAIAIDILTNLSLNDESGHDLAIDITQETCCAIQSFLLLSSNESIDKNQSYKLRKIFQNLVKLCHALRFKSHNNKTSQIVESLHFIITNVTINSIWFGLSCEALCSIGEISPECNDLSSIIELNTKEECIDEANLVKLFALHFQRKTLFNLTYSEAKGLVSCLENRNLWSCFRVMRLAMRYGHHIVATLLIDSIIQIEPKENLHFWLKSLSKICQGESDLIKSSNVEEIDKNLHTSISQYIEGLNNLKASVTPSNVLRFQIEYVKLRLKYLQTHELFSQWCKMVRTSPAPAIASSAALTTRDDLSKCGNIVVMMRKSAKEFRLLAESYSSLYQSSFNADDHSLAHLQLLQHSCVILAEVIESLFQSNRINALYVSKDIPFQGNDSLSELTAAPLEHRKMIDACRNISKIVNIDMNTHSSQQHKDAIGSKQVKLLQSVSFQLLQVPLCIPRFFFQSIQDTCIKLAISPQPKSSGDVLYVNNHTNLTLRIEGVIVNGGHDIIRKVCKVLLSINAVCTRSPVQQNNLDHNQLNKNACSDISLQSIVVPHNDYFQSQFLLSMTSTGLCTINIETCVIDENEAQWKTGPNMVLSAKVVDDPSLTCK